VHGDDPPCTHDTPPNSILKQEIDMTDPITAALTAAQVETTATLWTQPATFTPRVLERTFGDGRALFRVTTINSRPRWWLVRGCSTWTEDNDGHDGLTPVHDEIDEIIQAIADEFGGLPNMESETCCEEYVDPATGEPFDPADLVYPAIDDRTGSSWSHEDWPDLPGIDLVPHRVQPRAHYKTRILAERHAATIDA
jgi:hypothetical protein